LECFILLELVSLVESVEIGTHSICIQVLEMFYLIRTGFFG
jgi:hypothetical protein